MRVYAVLNGHIRHYRGTEKRCGTVTALLHRLHRFHVLCLRVHLRTVFIFFIQECDQKALKRRSLCGRARSLNKLLKARSAAFRVRDCFMF